ncbi:MAG: [protein-PII] uridylyltransferase [Mariprofundales bacterium]
MTTHPSSPPEAQQIQQQLEENISYIQHMFDVGASGQEMAQALSDRIDVLLCKLWRTLAPALIGRVELVSVGGFGRGELAPGSDLDLWFLFPAGASKEEMEKVQPFLYAVWDMGLKIGYAVRTVRECVMAMRDDCNTATAAMEARLVFGRGELFQSLQENITKFFQRRRQQFVQAKLDEMEQRHTRTGKTAFLMEPDLKEGIGGLRDIQTVVWLAKAWYGVSGGGDLIASGALSIRERQQLLAANDFLWRCRIGLHLNQGRARDRLSFEQQAMLADSMGYQGGNRPAVERFMKEYFRHAGRVVRLSGMITMHFNELLNPQTFSLSHTIGSGLTEENERVEIAHEAVFREQPLLLLQAFQLAQKGHRNLSSTVLRRIRADVLLIDDEIRQMPEAYAIFMEILRHRRNVAWAIKSMNDTGVLGRFIPEFRRVVGLGQFNRYHAYTVDEHTIRAIGEARNFRHGLRESRTPLAAEVMARIARPELLYLAIIFHDIAKGMDGDHSEVGSVIAQNFCHRAQLDAKACKLVPWLVTHHLTMALVSQRYDISDQEVINDFADQIENRENLDYLYCLTVADIAAVGPQVWTVWKGSLLADLYHTSSQALLGDQVTSDNETARISKQQQAALALVKSAQRAQAETELMKLPTSMVRQLTDHRLALVAQFLGSCSKQNCVETHIDSEHGGTLIMVHSRSRDGLFAALASVMNRCRVSVVSAQGFDLSDGHIVDIFLVQNMDGTVPKEETDLARLRDRISKVITSDVLPTQHAVTDWKIHVLMQQVSPKVCLLPRASTHYSVVEVTAADRPGILADLAATINRCHMHIHGTQISTFGERLVDVFFLERMDGTPLDFTSRQHLFAELYAVITLPKEVPNES